MLRERELSQEETEIFNFYKNLSPEKAMSSEIILVKEKYKMPKNIKYKNGESIR